MPKHAAIEYEMQAVVDAPPGAANLVLNQSQCRNCNHQWWSDRGDVAEFNTHETCPRCGAAGAGEHKSVDRVWVVWRFPL